MVALEILVLWPRLRRRPVLGGGRLIEGDASRDNLGVPLGGLALLLEGVIGARQPVAGALGPPGAVNGIGDGIAKAGVDLVSGSLRQQPEGIVDMSAGVVAGSQIVEDGSDDLLVVRVLLGCFLGGGEVFLEPRLEEPVIGCMPAMAIPGEYLGAGIEDRHVAAEEGPLLFWGAGPSAGAAATGGGSGSRSRRARSIGVIRNLARESRRLPRPKEQERITGGS